MIIGLTGTLGAGKSIVAEYLQKKGWVYFSLSHEVREEAKKQGIEITRENLQELGNDMRKKYGNDVLAQRILMKITDPQKNYVIDGIRNPAEIMLFKQLGSFYLIAVDAPKQLRFQRLIARNRESDPKTLYDFMRIDAIDQGKDQTESGQQTAECMKMADAVLVNDSTLERFWDKISFTVQQLINKDSLNSVGTSF
ncbi:MAG: AAA family ATPase [Candidatus Pacearchaeota archaeon]